MSAQREAEKAYTVTEAAERKGVSTGTIRRAIHATEGPCLNAKRVGGRIRISASELDAWFASLPDA